MYSQQLHVHVLPCTGTCILSNYMYSQQLHVHVHVLPCTCIFSNYMYSQYYMYMYMCTIHYDKNLVIFHWISCYNLTMESTCIYIMAFRESQYFTCMNVSKMILHFVSCRKNIQQIMLCTWICNICTCMYNCTVHVHVCTEHVYMYVYIVHV